MKNLTQKESQNLIETMMSGRMSHRDMATSLKRLAQKGETPDEIIGAIRAMRGRMRSICSPEDSVDTCGTGGDGKHTFNISTTAALVVAGAGVPVVKHGNRKASSMCGSADVLEELGVNITLTPRHAGRVLSSVGITFLFAPTYHPAMAQVAPVRKELGIRTLFNVLGPFCNPAGVCRQVIGVPNGEILEKLTYVAKALNYTHLALLTSDDGMDEISPAAKTRVRIIKGTHVSSFVIDPQHYDMHYSSITPIMGGDAPKNAAIITSILSGKQGALRDTILLNAAMALVVSGRVQSFEQGIELAITSIESKRAQNILKSFIATSNKYEYS